MPFRSGDVSRSKDTDKNLFDSKPESKKALWLHLLLETLLVILILVGVLYRFSWSEWHQGTNLHPDEYGMTNTLVQLEPPQSLDEYFNTRVSPLSPYNKYDLNGDLTFGGPDNRMRWGQWPIILIRLTAEWSGQTGYDQIRVWGRQLSALADVLTLGVLFLIGERLYGRKTALMGTALSALAVMQIQQSHFMTVDNFAVLFVSLAMYAAVRVAQGQLLTRPNPAGEYRPAWPSIGWGAAFGVFLGMAVASRINLVPLAGMIVVAAFIAVADLPLRRRSDIARVLVGAAILGLVAGAASVLSFRVTQPMSFRAATGETNLLTIHPNQDWVDSMAVATSESRGMGGGPPSEQWADRPAIIFPLMNMVVWGMGLTLGLTAWLGFGWATWLAGRYGDGWRSHLLPLVWVGGYFLFMGTRWVKSIRYFLPLYPFLCLLAAWALIRLWRSRVEGGLRLSTLPTIPLLATIVVLAGTLTYATSFVDAVYGQEHTRIRASRWMYANIPAPIQIQIQTADGEHWQAISASDGLRIDPDQPFLASFTAEASGQLEEIATAHAAWDAEAGEAGVTITGGEAGAIRFSAELAPAADGGRWFADSLVGQFEGGRLEAGQTYALTLNATQPFRLNRSVISNEDWDEGLPLYIEGRDAYGQLYRGIQMNVRWYDDENKRAMFLENLAQVDYILLPSQRGLWSVGRMWPMYPMTIEYYRALFDGQLGFELAAHFQAPMVIGPLQISDVGGTWAWGEEPVLPVFNFNFLAVEEAFSVYDHPPVWIFRKRADFDMESVRQILEAIDLSQVEIVAPVDMDVVPFEQ
jgi:hypothetical protein